MILKTGTKRIPFTEWGYVILIILIIPVTIVSFIFIIIPLFFIKKKKVLSSSFLGNGSRVGVTRTPKAVKLMTRQS